MTDSILSVEYDLVASVVADPSQLLTVEDIRPEMFADHQLGVLFGAIQATNGRFTTATLVHDLRKHDRTSRALDEFMRSFGTDDPHVAINALQAHGAESGSAALLGEKIRDAAIERQVRQAIAQIKPSSFNSNAEWASVLADHVTRISTIGASGGGANALEAGLDSLMAELEHRRANPDMVPGLRVNLGEFDTLAGGLQGGELIMVGGATGEGKSLILSHMALEAVTTPRDRDGRTPTVAFFSLEMSAKELNGRFVSKFARVDPKKRYPTDDEWDKIKSGEEVVRGFCREQRLLLFEPEHCSTVEQICREIVRAKQSGGLDVAFVDYVQLVGLSSGHNEMQGHERLGEIARRLKLLALQLDIPIVVAVQLNRESMREHPTARPASYHIAGSIDLLKHADALHLVWRPAKHISWDIGPWGNIAVLLTPKRRNGTELPDLYFATRGNVCHFEPVPEDIRAELAAKRAQDLINGKSKTY